MPVLFICFVLVPVAELWLLFQVGGWIGGLNTIALIVLTAFVGASLLRKQGLATMLSANRRFQEGQLPISEFAHGVLLAFAGALLLTPGFMTDVVGFCLLSPYVRKQLAERFVKKVAVSSVQGFSHSQGAHSQRGFYHEAGMRSGAHENDEVIDGEFHEINKDELPPRDS